MRFFGSDTPLFTRALAYEPLYQRPQHTGNSGRVA